LRHGEDVADIRVVRAQTTTAALSQQDFAMSASLLLFDDGTEAGGLKGDRHRRTV